MSSVIRAPFDMEMNDDTNKTNKRISEDTNMMNYIIAQNTNKMQRGMFDEQMAFARDQDEYQRALQERIFGREDTAIQRQAADSRAAGISPLAGITGGSTQGVYNGASQPSAPALTSPTMQGYTAQRPDLSAISQIGQEVMQYASLRQDIKRKILENEYLERSLDARVDSAEYDKLTKYGYLFDTSKDRWANDFYGLSKNMSEKERIARILITGIFGHGQSTVPVSTTLGANGLGDNISFSSPRNLSADDIKNVFKFVTSGGITGGSPSTQSFFNITNGVDKSFDDLMKSADKKAAELIDNLNDKFKSDKQKKKEAQKAAGKEKTNTAIKGQIDKYKNKSSWLNKAGIQ